MEALNRKEKVMNEVMEIVLRNCGYSFRKVTEQEVVSKRGDILIQMTRCVYVTMLMFLDYTKPAVAARLNRTEQAIDDILTAAHEYRSVRKDWTYILSEADCAKECEKYKNVNWIDGE